MTVTVTTTTLQLRQQGEWVGILTLRESRVGGSPSKLPMALKIGKLHLGNSPFHLSACSKPFSGFPAESWPALFCSPHAKSNCFCQKQKWKKWSLLLHKPCWMSDSPLASVISWVRPLMWVLYMALLAALPAPSPLLQGGPKGWREGKKGCGHELGETYC